MKTCSRCGETKPAMMFSKRTASQDGLQHQCKSCKNIENSEYRASNPEKEKARNANYHAANKDKVRAKDAKWYAANAEKKRADVAAWAAENREAKLIQNHNYRARANATGGKLSSGLAGKLFKLQRGKCACGCKQPLGADYHRDHIMPLALGGTNTDDNMQLLRSTCNQQKYKKHPVEFMQSRGFII